MNPQNIEKLNVWNGIRNSQIIGPFYTEGNLNGEKNRHLLEEVVWPIISQIINTSRIEPFLCNTVHRYIILILR